MYEPELRAIWTDADDEVYSPITKERHTSNQATIWRWREEYQNDFAARIDWSNTPNYKKANHPPVAKLDHSNELLVKSGDIVKLSAKGSTDPDGDKLSYQWMVYKEVGTLNISRRAQEASFVALETDKVGTIHVILKVTDDGEPALTRYQRVIVNVMPK